MIKVAPSILAADPLALGRDAERAAEAGADLLHVDIMDGHFVPNLSFSPAVARALHRALPALPLDVHLMVDDPRPMIGPFADAGAWNITVHLEAAGAEEALRSIRARGIRAGLSLKPATPVESVLPLLPLCDMVLVMTVEPGFGGQEFQPAMLEKLRALRAAGCTGLLEADGGVRMSNLPLLADAGLDVAVMGTAFFRADDPAAMVRQIHAMGR